MDHCLLWSLEPFQNYLPECTARFWRHPVTSEFYSNALPSASTNSVLLSSTFYLIRENVAAEEEHPGSELTGLCTWFFRCTWYSLFLILYVFIVLLMDQSGIFLKSLNLFQPSYCAAILGTTVLLMNISLRDFGGYIFFWTFVCFCCSVHIVCWR